MAGKSEINNLAPTPSSGLESILKISWKTIFHLRSILETIIKILTSDSHSPSVSFSQPVPHFSTQIQIDFKSKFSIFEKLTVDILVFFL